MKSEFDGLRRAMTQLTMQLQRMAAGNIEPTRQDADKIGEVMLNVDAYIVNLCDDVKWRREAVILTMAHDILFQITEQLDKSSQPIDL